VVASSSRLHFLGLDLRQYGQEATYEPREPLVLTSILVAPDIRGFEALCSLFSKRKVTIDIETQEQSKKILSNSLDDLKGLQSTTLPTQTSYVSAKGNASLVQNPLIE